METGIVSLFLYEHQEVLLLILQFSWLQQVSGKKSTILVCAFETACVSRLISKATNHLIYYSKMQ